VHRHPHLTKEGDRLIHRQRAQYAADEGRAATPEIAFGYDGVGDVAAGTAADQDFGARLPGAFDEHDASIRIGSPREDRRGEAGSARADNGNLARRGQCRQQPKLTAKAAAARLRVLPLRDAPRHEDRSLRRGTLVGIELDFGSRAARVAANDNQLAVA
jgi:hypothetical protein